MLTRLFAGLAFLHRRHLADIDLAEMSDHQLRDIGLTRHDIRGAARHRSNERILK